MIVSSRDSLSGINDACVCSCARHRDSGDQSKRHDETTNTHFVVERGKISRQRTKLNVERRSQRGTRQRRQRRKRRRACFVRVITASVGDGVGAGVGAAVGFNDDGAKDEKQRNVKRLAIATRQRRAYCVCEASRTCFDLK